MIDALWAIDRALVSDAARPRSRASCAAGRTDGAPSRLARPPNESDDDHFTREALLQLLGELGEDAAVLAEADGWRASGSPRRTPAGGVSSDLARIALPLAAKRGDEALWQQMLAVLKSPPTPEARILALSGLTGFDNPVLVERTLALVIEGTIKPQDLRYLFPAMAMRRASRDVTLAWIQAHLDEVVPKIPSAAVGRLINAVTALCDASRVRSFESFMTARPRSWRAWRRSCASRSRPRCAARRWPTPSAKPRRRG